MALKVLPEAFTSDPDRLARFEREAKVLASLNHPNIGSIYGLEEAEGVKALVLELVEGPTLADCIASGSLSPGGGEGRGEGGIPIEDALPIARQIAEALEAAHEQGVIHRDLKPANVKVKDDGTVKVLDFGLAKAFQPDASHPDGSASPTISLTAAASQLGMVIGTAAYMSPEQARARPIDKRADIWAFGAVLFEMLSGHRAFSGVDVTDVLAAVVRAEPEWSRLPATVNARLREVVERCLEKDVKNRWHDIADVRVDIQRCLAGATSERVEPAAGVAQCGWQSKVIPVVAATALGLLIGAVGWGLGPPEQRGTVRFSHVLSGGERFLAVNNNSTVAISSDGLRMAYSTGGLNIRAMDALDATALVLGSEIPVAPFFAPNGEWLGYWSLTERQLKKVPVGGGAPVALATTNQPRGTPFWGSDDTIIYAQDDGIFRVSANGGSPVLLVSGNGLASPQILPDGQSVLFSEATGDTPNVVILSPESEERHVVAQGVGPRYVATGHLVYLRDDALYAVPLDLDTLALGVAVSMVEDVRSVPPQYAVSETGTLVSIPGQGADLRTLALVGRNGVVNRLNIQPARYLSPRLSPDGNRLAVQTSSADGTSDIWVLDSLRGDTPIRQLTTEGATNIRPVWVDGGRLAFGSDRDGEMGIYIQPADGSDVAERMTTAEDGSSHEPESWSPLHRTLSFSEIFRDGSSALLTVSLDPGATPEPFFDVAGSMDRFSVFSPDGNWLAYSSTETGTFEVWLQPFPAGSGVKHRITQNGRAMALWSPDGGELFYRPSPPGAAGFSLFSIELTTEPRFAFTTERSVPAGDFVVEGGSRYYDITPDGQALLVVVRANEDAAYAQLNVVLNWFEELEARVPVP